MKPILYMVHRGEDGITIPMPFTYKSGEMMAIVEDIAEFLVNAELTPLFWEAVAADRLGVILDQNLKLKEAAKVISALKGEVVGALGA